MSGSCVVLQEEDVLMLMTLRALTVPRLVRAHIISRLLVGATPLLKILFPIHQERKHNPFSFGEIGKFAVQFFL